MTTYARRLGLFSGTMAVIGGDASFTANFATGHISGSFTNMISAFNDHQSLPWNDVSVSASIAMGTSTFSGSTSIASTPAIPSANAYLLKGAATGHIDGGFYGRAANEIGAVWTLSNGDGTGSAIGVVGARKQ